MTGRSPLRFGMAGPIIDRGGLPLGETTMGEIFRDAGYQTWFLGKWHLGHDKRAYFPNERGWDHSYGSLTGGLDHYSHNSDVVLGAPTGAATASRSKKKAIRPTFTPVRLSN